ncbi:MAG: hypothetical protein CMJ75_08385 [Planctomycetaceae bacterium]|nr:hypothetical protein [Planctomycetaceae bacterium]
MHGCELLEPRNRPRGRASPNGPKRRYDQQGILISAAGDRNRRTSCIELIPPPSSSAKKPPRISPLNLPAALESASLLL